MRDDRRAASHACDRRAESLPRGKKPDVAIFSFPPTCSGAALVLMM